MVPLPLLCECRSHNGLVMHNDQRMSYVHWSLPVGHNDYKTVIFLERSVLDLASYKGRTLKQLLDYKTPEESCRMISRDFIRSVKCTPDYVVIVHESGMGNLVCSHTMDGILTESAKNPTVDHIRKLAEGDEAAHNILGRHLASISQDLVAKGYLGN